MHASLEVLEDAWGWRPAVGGGGSGGPAQGHDWAVLGALSPSLPARGINNSIGVKGVI